MNVLSKICKYIFIYILLILVCQCTQSSEEDIEYQALELQMVVKHIIVLRAELRSSERATNAFKH